MGTAPGASTIGTPREDLIGAYHEYDPSLDGFVADKIFAKQTVNKRVGTYGIIPAAELLRRINTVRGPVGPTSRTDFTPDSDTFALYEFTTEQKCPSVLGDIYADWFDQEEVATQINALHIYRDLETIALNAAFSSTTLPADNVTGANGAAVWTNRTSADPIGDIETGKLAVSKYKGRRPNALLMCESLWESLRICDQMIKRCTQMYGPVVDGALPESAVGKILDIQYLIIARATYDANPPGSAASSVSYIAPSDQALLFCLDPARPRMPNLGMMMEPANSAGVMPDEYMEPQSKSKVVRLTRHCQPKVNKHPAAYRLATLA